jgi:hypothetical protein
VSVGAFVSFFFSFPPVLSLLARSRDALIIDCTRKDTRSFFLSFFPSFVYRFSFSSAIAVYSPPARIACLTVCCVQSHCQWHWTPPFVFSRAQSSIPLRAIYYVKSALRARPEIRLVDVPRGDDCCRDDTARKTG